MRLGTLLLLAVLLLATAVVGRVLAEDDGMTYRTFDVSVLTAARPSARAELLGHAPVFDPDGDAEGDPPDPFLGDVVDFVRRLTDPELWDEEGALLHLVNPDTLLVRHRPEVVREVEDVLRRITRHASERVLLRFGVVEGEAGSLSALPPDATPTDAASLELPFGVERFVKVTNRIRYVSEYEVEIAQGSNISNPIVTFPEEGFLADVIAHPSLDGDRVVVEALLQRGRFVPEPRQVELGIDEEYFAGPYRSDERKSLGRLDLPEFRHVDLHVTATVATGESVAIPVAGREGQLTFVVHAERLGERGDLPLLDLGALTKECLPLHFGLGGYGDRSIRRILAPRVRYLADVGTRPFGFVDEAADHAQQVVAPGRWGMQGGEIFSPGAGRLCVRASPEATRRVRAFLSDREAELIRPVVLDLRVYSVPARAVPGPGRQVSRDGARLVAGGRLHTIPRRMTSLIAGSTMNFLADYDVEVAQEARIADPIVGQSFDGLLANLWPRLSVDRRTVEVDVRLTLATRTLETEPFVTGARFLGPIDRLQVRRLDVNTTVRVPANGTCVMDGGVDPEDPSRWLAVELGAELP